MGITLLSSRPQGVKAGLSDGIGDHTAESMRVWSELANAGLVTLVTDFSLCHYVGFRTLELLVTKKGRAREDLTHRWQPLPFTDGELGGQPPRAPTAKSGTHSVGSTSGFPS